MASSSAAVYTAVPFDTRTSVDGDLKEPLISADVKKSSAERNETITPNFLRMVKIISFLVGSVVALFSQYVLSQTMWRDNILTASTQSVVFFSLIWSFWTCIFVFISLVCMTKVLSARFKAAANDDVLFQVEAHHIVGAILSISLAWVLFDCFHTGAKIPAHWLMLPLVVVVFWAFSSKISESKEETMEPTYQMIAATLGLILGLCSQFLLSMVLWSDHMRKPILDDVFTFSLVWSLCTVVITFTGCMSLRFLASSESTNRLAIERTFLRMESYYVFSSLIGICFAWIIIDWCMNMKEQILPSLVMLGVSLIAFRVILYCFPEEQCLEELGLSEDEVDEPKKPHAHIQVV